MNIVIFTEINVRGGLDTFLVNLINNWPNSSDILTIYCNNNHQAFNDLKNQINRKVFFYGYSFNKLMSFLYNLPTNNNKNILFKIFYRIIELPIVYTYFVFFLFKKIFYKKKYDRLLVVNGGYPGSLICRAAPLAWFLTGHKGKVLFNFHGMCTPISFFAFYEFFIDFLVKKFSYKFISVSNASTNSILTRKIFYYSKKITIYNGITDLYTKNKNKAKSKNQYCLMLGRLHPEKGHFLLINSFQLVIKEIPTAKLFIYGDGATKYKEDLISLINKNKLRDNIFLSSHINNICNVLNDAIMLIAPSIADESFNYTIIEAMCFKKPVIVTNKGGMPEIINGSCGGFVVQVNERKLADKIIELLRNKNLVFQMGQKGRSFYEQKYKASKMSQHYHDAII